MSEQIPETMPAMVLTGHGGLDKLEYHADWPVPSPAAGEALVRVKACGLNNTDINTRIAWYSTAVTEGTTEERGTEGFQDVSTDLNTWGGSGIAFPRIQGADLCGEVVALGAETPRSLLGRRVLIDPWLRDWSEPLSLDKCGYFGSERDGGFAAYTTGPVTNIHPVDSDLSDAELATFATSYVTAENMLVQARVNEGDTVLITGASGGVGSALVQLVRRRGAHPIAMCGESKKQQVKEIGAEVVLPREASDLRGLLKAHINDTHVDVVADVVGGPMWGQFIDAIRRGGTYTCAGAIAGPIVELDLRKFYLNNLSFTGATITPPGLFAELVGYIERGEIRPLLSETWPLESLRDAQRSFMQKRHIGKLVAVTDR